MIQEFNKINSVKGELKLPGDKSISHRTVMFSAMAEGQSIIHNLLNSEDVNSTINCFRNLGCEIKNDGKKLIVNGKGYKGFTKPKIILDAGNSGTTARLICGILAAQNFSTEIIGDSSLSNRPMMRIVEPLSLMGANIKTSKVGTLPLLISRSNNFHNINYELPVASAQVKSAVLLAGLHLDETTVVVEHAKTRNHTEKLLGLRVEEKDDYREVFVSKENYPTPKEYFVPSDISSAAFFIVLTLLSKNSELLLKNVLLNDTRTGVLKVLLEMGGNIVIQNEQESNGEIFGDLLVSSSKLHNINISPSLIPNLIDEIPILSIAGIFSNEIFSIRDAKELRFKESDRINALCSNFRKLGLECEEYEDGFDLSGEIKNENQIIESFGDHRIAMAFSILALITDKKIRINDFECVAISNPSFLDQIKSITL